jgi:hypothetical protein
MSEDDNRLLLDRLRDAFDAYPELSHPDEIFECEREFKETLVVLKERLAHPTVSLTDAQLVHAALYGDAPEDAIHDLAERLAAKDAEIERLREYERDWKMYQHEVGDETARAEAAEALLAARTEALRAADRLISYAIHTGKIAGRWEQKAMKWQQALAAAGVSPEADTEEGA